MVKFEFVKGVLGIFEDARQVRRAVFVNEQGYSEIGEFDDTDKVAVHIIGYDQGSPVCAGRYFCDEQGENHIGRVAVLSSHRKMGLGLQMMQTLLDYAKKQGDICFVLNSQEDKQEFYTKLGFVATEKKTMDEGQPHVEMKLKLAQMMR